MTRTEHLAWCKKRALEEMAYSHDPSQGVISMMSDLGKHPETASQTLSALCLMMLRKQPKPTEADIRKFIDGFN